MKTLLKIAICCAFNIVNISAIAQNRNVAINTSNTETPVSGKLSNKSSAPSSTHKDSLKPEQLYKYAVSLLLNSYPSADKQKQGVTILKNMFNSGDAAAGMFLADAYFKGIGMDRDEEKSIKIIEKLAAKQHPEALYKLGTFYSEGGYNGYIENKPKAIEFYKKAAAKGYTAAYASLGQIAEENLQYSDAVQWYKKGVQNKDVKSMARLGNMYETGKGLDKPNLDDAARIYHQILTSREYEHSKFYSVYESFYSIGNKVPSLNPSLFKSILNQLLGAAGNSFKQIMGEEFQPIIWERNDTDRAAKQFETYYKVNLDAGLKNAQIIRRMLPTNLNSISKIDTTYSYQADVLFYATPQKTKEVFNKWVLLLKQTLPSSVGTVEGEQTYKPSFSIPVRLTTGKNVTIALEVLGKKSDRLVFKILE